MLDFRYLKKLVDFLQSKDPYSNVYLGYSTHLRNLVDKLTKLEKKIYREINFLKEKHSKD